MALYHAVIRAPDGHEQDLMLDADSRELAMFAAGKTLGAHYPPGWTLVKLTTL